MHTQKYCEDNQKLCDSTKYILVKKTLIVSSAKIVAYANKKLKKNKLLKKNHKKYWGTKKSL